MTLPKTARLQLQKFAGRLDNLEVLNLVSVPKGHGGLVFMNTIAVNNSGHGVGFLEGCPHMFDPPDQAWPGILLGSGTEDYFDSGWYFNAGEFRLPVAGDTHMLQNKSVAEWSAYRFHEMDPLRFSDGVRVTWRCGEGGGPPHTTDGSGKCYNELPDNGDPYLGPGAPKATGTGDTLCEWVESYGWVYVWPADGIISSIGSSSSSSISSLEAAASTEAVSTVELGWDESMSEKYDAAIKGEEQRRIAAKAGWIGQVSAPVTVDESAPDVDKYFLGKQGDSCTATCAAQKLHCSWHVETNNSEAIFTQLGVTCKKASSPSKWWAGDQPSFCSGDDP